MIKEITWFKVRGGDQEWELDGVLDEKDIEAEVIAKFPHLEGSQIVIDFEYRKIQVGKIQL